MKKLLCYFIIGGICMNFFGCTNMNVLFGTVSKKEQKALLRHLENKYGEEFVIKETKTYSSSGNALAPTRCVYVYPEGKEDKIFEVRIDYKTFIDDYVLCKPEEQMQSLYAEWIQSKIPSAKAAIKLSYSGYNQKEIFYDPDKPLQQFVTSAEGAISIGVNIMLEESMLEQKDSVFEALSELFADPVLTDFYSYEYSIGFYTEEAFGKLEPGEFVQIPRGFKFYTPEELADYTAATYCIDVPSSPPNPPDYTLLAQMYDNLEQKEEKMNESIK